MNTMTVSNIELTLIISGILIWIYIITRFASYNYIMSNLSILITDIATDMVYKSYKNKKTFYNSNGNISSTAEKAIQSKVDELQTTCQFYSEDFYYYYKQHKPVLKAQLKDFLIKYIKSRHKIKPIKNYNSLTPEQFFRLKKKQTGDMVGVYILYNHNKKIYYVGQATRLFFRVNQHFTGHGNGDVYADYKRGKHKFTIKLLPLTTSGYYDLDKLEKDMISKYNSYYKGYNKTRGNSIRI